MQKLKAFFKWLKEPCFQIDIPFTTKKQAVRLWDKQYVAEYDGLEISWKRFWFAACKSSNLAEKFNPSPKGFHLHKRKDAYILQYGRFRMGYGVETRKKYV